MAFPNDQVHAKRCFTQLPTGKGLMTLWLVGFCLQATAYSLTPRILTPVSRAPQPHLTLSRSSRCPFQKQNTLGASPVSADAGSENQVQDISADPEIESGVNEISRLMRFYNMVRPIMKHGLQKQQKNRIGGRVGRKKWMNSAAFQSLTKWAFAVCDADGNGQISRDDLYSGILLVHLYLAKYVGIAACQPLNRTQVNDLFDIAASAGKIGLNEFQDIAVLSCARISSRVMIYWAVLVVLVPFLTARTILLFRRIGIVVVPAYAKRLPWMQKLSVLGIWFAEHAVSVAVFTAFVPWIYGKIDLYYAKKRKEAIEKRRFSAWDAFREKYLSLPQPDRNSNEKKGITDDGDLAGS